MSKELSPLKTFELLCRYCVEEINILRHKQIVEDYFYNEEYKVSITDKKTLKKGFTANIEKALKAVEIIKGCLVGEYEVLDNCSIDNAFKSPYRFRIYMDGITFNEWILKDKEEYDLLKEVLL